MASGYILHVESVIRGHHVYKAIWNLESENSLSYAGSLSNNIRYMIGCIMKGGAVVGHAPREIFGVGGGHHPLWKYLVHSERKTKTRQWFRSSVFFLLSRK